MNVAGVAVMLATVVLTEAFAWTLHRWVMHGPGWRWHRLHHAPGGAERRRLSANDLFGLPFVVIAVALCTRDDLLWWAGVGVALYGLLYAVVHEGLAHGRLGRWRVPRQGLAKRLVQAHRLHHAVRGRDGAVAYGFLWTPSPAVLRERLRRSGRLRTDHEDVADA